MPVHFRGIDGDTYSVVEAQLAVEASITATSSATGDTCITTGAFSVENGGFYYVDVYSPYLTKGTTNLDVELWDGATLVSTLSGHMAASQALPGGITSVRTRLAAGAHNLTVKAFVDGGTGKFGAGAGTTGAPPNAWIRVRPA